MGVVISINGYLKEPSCIVGHISFLGYYEVKEDAIEKFRIRQEPIFHYGELYLITESRKEIAEITDHKLNETALLFYQLASCRWSGQSLGKHEGQTTCLMFEASSLLYPITELIAAKDNILHFLKQQKDKSTIREIKENGEIETLLAFKSLIEEAIEKNAMIGISMG
ncbi:hypothetical protein CLV59_108181 [Chitinophaga dinghuensis]|uniref:Uncharacterized protein n=1 Tax=Chitinophaga dinghuensis TaxID=1539050 RepID=A0A327VMW0_9BACT|nr:hypothetical protein [Chitinophaga dinghuensis]RAJ76661.1 hypothetical protein CLV59_108181 [Chitinophaga dinghuensis]